MRRWLVALGIAAIGVAWVATPVAAQFTSFRRDETMLLDGNWQSCRDDDGYTERVDDVWDPVAHRLVAEFHLGPFHDFAWFTDVAETHRDHASALNLLQPYNIGAGDEQLAWHTWDVPGYRIHVSLAGGSRDDCESWYVTVTRRGGR